jgi:hypothetical protein
MILSQTTVIAASPAAVFAFLRDMEANYTLWHPGHIAFRQVSGEPLCHGSTFRIEERIDGHRIARTMLYTRIEPDRLIEFVPASRLIRLFLRRVRFIIRPAGEGCAVSQEVHIVIGPIGRVLNRRGLEAVRRHMAEEGINLKRMVEDETPRPG